MLLHRLSCEIGNSVYERNWRRYGRKIWLLKSHFSRSLKVIGTDTDRLATYDFLLVIHSNHGTISYRFRDKQRFMPKIANFPPLSAPLESYNVGSAKKTIIMQALSDSEQFDDVCIRSYTIPACNIRTDGQICDNSISLCMHRHAARDKTEDAREDTPHLIRRRHV